MANQIDSEISFNYVNPDQEEPVIVPQLELDDEEPHTSSGSESEVDDDDLHSVTSAFSQSSPKTVPKNDPEMEKLKLQLKLAKIQLNLKEVEESHAANPASAKRETPYKPKLILPKLDQNDNIDSFLCSFERILSDNNIPKAQWLGLLVPRLGSGKARDAYTDIHAPDNLTYDELKRAILEHYELTPEAYRRKFRGHSRSDNQSFKEANGKLAYLVDKWVETYNIPKTYNGLREKNAHGPGVPPNAIRAQPVCAGKRAILIERDGHGG